MDNVTNRVSESGQPGRSRRGKRRPILVLVGVIIVLVMISIILWAVLRSNFSSPIDNSKYQAVFFTNGQVYFGKLKMLGDGDLDLTDIFYLQSNSTTDTSTSKNPQETSDSSDVQLIKLGSEIHGPEDEMIINKEQVLFYENLKPTGKVSESIASYQKN